MTAFISTMTTNELWAFFYNSTVIEVPMKILTEGKKSLSDMQAGKYFF